MRSMVEGATAGAMLDRAPPPPSAVPLPRRCATEEESWLAPKASVLQAPFRQDLLERAVGLDLGERGVDFLEELLVRLAHADADRADDHRLVARDQPDVREAPLLQVV